MSDEASVGTTTVMVLLGRGHELDASLPPKSLDDAP